MVMARSLRRQTDVRSAKRKFIIYSEGKNTEPDYFRTLKNELFGALVDVEIIDAAGVPMTIAKRASEDAARRFRRNTSRSSFEEEDEVWAVFDRDDHPHVTQALALCRGAKVGVGFSDPCFELWLLLHRGPFDKPDNRRQVQKALQKCSPDYDPDKRKTTDCSALLEKVEEAEDRAEKQLARRKEEGDPPARPYTTVYRLTRRMREAHDAYRIKDKHQG